MKILGSYKDLALEYIKLKYPEKIIAVLYDIIDTDFVEDFIEFFNVSYGSVEEVIFIELENPQEALMFSSLFDMDSDIPYYTIVDKGKVVFEGGSSLKEDYLSSGEVYEENHI